MEFGEKVVGLFNPTIALQRLLQDTQAQNTEEARRAAKKLERILDRLAENLSLGEQEFYVDRGILANARYEQSPLDQRLAYALRQQGRDYIGKDRSGNIRWHYRVYLRYERRLS